MTDPAEQPTTGMPNLDLEAGSRFIAAAGLVVDEVSGTRLRGHLDLGPEHHTPWGVVHGGVYTTAVESAASIGASTAVADRGQFAVGVHKATDFLRPSTGGRAEVLAVPLQQGRTQQLWLVTITNDQGKELARGQLRLQNVPSPRQALEPELALPFAAQRLARGWSRVASGTQALRATRVPLCSVYRPGRGVIPVCHSGRQVRQPEKMPRNSYGTQWKCGMLESR
jgi:1,4-dihydroxy-2-naphthoyl-CoA hydrolase